MYSEGLDQGFTLPYYRTDIETLNQLQTAISSPPNSHQRLGETYWFPPDPFSTNVGIWVIVVMTFSYFFCTI